MAESPVYVLERSFIAPRELVWKTWTDPSLFARWYGPNVETIVHRQDLRVGGECFIEMRMQRGSGFQKLVYQEVTAPGRLVWLHHNTDADGAIAANPQMPDWPRTLLTVVTFEQTGTQTELRLEWSPHNASDAEVACFAAAIGGLGRGWNAGMEVLDKLLAELQRSPA